MNIYIKLEFIPNQNTVTTIEFSFLTKSNFSPDITTQFISDPNAESFSRDIFFIFRTTIDASVKEVNSISKRVQKNSSKIINMVREISGNTLRLTLAKRGQGRKFMVTELYEFSSKRPRHITLRFLLYFWAQQTAKNKQTLFKTKRLWHCIVGL